MKLLLDEMHDPAVAEILRADGHDVRAAAEFSELRGLRDAELLIVSTLDGRALVTENVKDFSPRHAAMLARDEPHGGLIFTHPRRFPRARRDAASRLASALAEFLAYTPPALAATPFVWWLAEPRER